MSNIKNKLFRFYNSVAVIVLFACSVLSAAYVNVITLFLASDKLSLANLASAVYNVGWWNIVILVVLILVYVQFKMSSWVGNRIDVHKERLINKIMEVTARSIVYPHAASDQHIRAIVTLYRKKDKTRITKFSYNTEPDPERLALFPADFGVTGKAFLSRQVVIEELSANHMKNYPKEVRKFILKDLKTVIAAPITDLCVPYELPLGVLAFDSSLNLSSLGLRESELRGIAQGCADAIAIVLFSSPERMQ